LALVPRKGAIYRATRNDGTRWRFRIDHLDKERVYLRRFTRVGRKWDYRGAIKMPLEQWADAVTKQRMAGK
jgi:hypothetical protein